MRWLALLAVMASCGACCATPDRAENALWTPGIGPFAHPRGYVCTRAGSPPEIDGRLDDAPWQDAPWTDDFVDIAGGSAPRPRLRTRARLLWDDEHLYVAADLEESHVWAARTEHDDVLHHENNFEVFLDPDGDGHTYFELQVNALGTTWDQFLAMAYRDGRDVDKGWEIPGLRSAIGVDGTLGDAADRDRGWTVELAIPWDALADRAGRPCPPGEGDRWRVNFSRVQWRHRVRRGAYEKLPGGRADDWVWSPQGVVDMHRPERWGYVQFTSRPAGAAEFVPDASHPARESLHTVYYAQKVFREAHGRWARSLAELGLATRDLDPPVRLLTTPGGYSAEARAGGRTWSIRHDSLISSR